MKNEAAGAEDHESSEALWDLGLSDAFAAYEVEQKRRADKRGDRSPSGITLVRGSESAGIHLQDGSDEVEGVALRPGHRSGDRCGRFFVLGELARGGMGVVLQGRDVDLGRDVALKVLHESHADDPRLVQRFIEEAQIGGQLQHPGIVPVYEIGLDDSDRPFFAMKLVRGRTLAALLAERKDPGDGLGRFLDIFEKTCQTLAFAHSRGVVHRDLKPANVMVGRFGEVQVVDWGFAKVLSQGGIADELLPTASDDEVATIRSSSPSSHSQAGSVLGTPSYMPPEQAQGNVESLDERADVFALGAMLCELISGHPPYVRVPGSDVMTLAQGASLEGAWERLDACDADEELIELARRCLAPKPHDRPRSAGVVADEIASYTSSREQAARSAQVQAAEARVRVREERKARRLTLALAGLGSVMVLLAAGFFFRQRSAERKTEQEIRSAVADARDEALSGEVEAAWAFLRRAQGLAEAGDPTPAALAELRNAEELLQQEGARADRARRDARMRERLTEIQGRPSPDHASADEDYEEAFRDYGLDALAMSPEESAARVSAISDPAMRGLMARALDDWAGRRRLRRDAGSVGWRDLLSAARLADPDPLRGQLREALLTGTLPLLQRISRELDPGAMTPRSLHLLAMNLERLGDGEQALAVLRRAVAAQPGDYALHRELARILSRSKNKDNLAEARVHALICLSHQPRSVALRQLLADIAGRSSDPVARLRFLNEALAIDPTHETCRLQLAQAFIDQGRLVEARREVDKVFAQSSENPHAHFVLAAIHERAGDERARKEALAAGRTLYMQQRMRKRADQVWRKRPRWRGLDDLRLRVARQPNDPETQAELASALSLVGDHQAGLRAARKALALNPNSPMALSAEAGALEGLGRYEAAIEAAYRARECGLDSRSIAFRIEDCRRKLALTPLLDSPELPESARDRLVLARCALDKGQAEKAAVIFDSVFPDDVAGILRADEGEKRPPKGGGHPSPQSLRGLRYHLRQAAVSCTLAAQETRDLKRRLCLLTKACLYLEARSASYRRGGPRRRRHDPSRQSSLIWWHDLRLKATRGETTLIEGLPDGARRRWAAAWATMASFLPRSHSSDLR